MLTLLQTNKTILDYLSRMYMFCLLLQLTISLRKLHYKIVPFSPQLHLFLGCNDAHIGSIGTLMIVAAAVCLRSLFCPPNTVTNLLSTWPRTPISHLQQFSSVSKQQKNLESISQLYFPAETRFSLYFICLLMFYSGLK